MTDKRPKDSLPASTISPPDAVGVALARCFGIGKLDLDGSLQRVSGGRNNQCFRVLHQGRQYFAKHYFSHPLDPRDRLRTEFSFSQFCWRHGVDCIAQPIAQFPDLNVAVFAYLEGRKLAGGEVESSAVAQAIRFFASVNAHKSSSDAASLPPASEACFSLESHIACVRGRVDRLAEIGPDDDLNQEAQSFATNEIVPRFQTLLGGLQRELRGQVGREDVLPPIDRCLSPSDFGFHNALLAGDGQLRFVDFEYAGWDDPAKTYCDFFCQVELPVPQQFRSEFLQMAQSSVRDRESLGLRARLLMPFYRLKWCCILLNEFQPTSIQRRAFSNAAALDCRPTQLARAREFVKTVKTDFAEQTG